MPQPASFENNEQKQEQTSTYCYVVWFNPGTGSGHRNLWTKYDKAVVIEQCPDSIGGGTKTFQPVQINHGRIESSAEYTAKSIGVSIIASDELKMFFTTAAANKITINILRVNTAQLVNAGGVIEYPNHVYEVGSGVLDSIAFAGSVITGMVIPEPFYLNRLIPRYAFQRQCNHQLYELNTCGAVKGNFRLDSTIVSWTRSHRELRIQGQRGGDAPLSFVGGYLRHVESDLVFGVTKETLSAGDTFLRLNSWNAALEDAGDDVDVFRGCRHTIEDCVAFGRKAHFGGFPYIPNKNPSIHGV